MMVVSINNVLPHKILVMFYMKWDLWIKYIITIIYGIYYHLIWKTLEKSSFKDYKREYFIYTIIFSLAMSEQQSFPYMPSRFLLTYDSLRSAQKYN